MIEVVVVPGDGIAIRRAPSATLRAGGAVLDRVARESLPSFEAMAVGSFTRPPDWSTLLSPRGAAPSISGAASVGA
jgi:hypothetical protein